MLKGIFNLIKIIFVIAALVAFLRPLAVFAACTDIPICGSESLNYYVTNTEQNGNPVTYGMIYPVDDGMILPANSTIYFYISATAYGECHRIYYNCEVGPIYQRTVNHAAVGVDVATIPISGNYAVGNVFCMNDKGGTAFYHELVGGTALCPSTPSNLLLYPGVYKYTIKNIINNPLCLDICTPSVTEYMTVYVADPANETGCNMLTGKGVSASNGKVLNQETDFSIPGSLGITFKRYYHTVTASMKRSFGKWGSTFDTVILKLGPNDYKIVNADGSTVYYNDSNNDSIYEPVMPKGEKSILNKNSDNSFIRTFPDRTIEGFNLSGYLTSIADRNGNVTNLSRDSGNKLTMITDPSGRTISFNYNEPLAKVQGAIFSI